MNEHYKITTDRISEVIHLNVRKPGWTQIDIGEHMCAVIVFGANQKEADARAAWIVARCNRRKS